ncbi:MAG: hypothetical protein COU28_03820 [Candidatus Magasanikbacteria bacterium CG10_big_fil_rev_8_21_14_0_10_36_16]|uniref:Uncharacterized protein n=1 Tax=Candidatus Magasanikbacteria bacterium CG10_big_fil_rev_8_21_14_0_10_36_16 TaxID=1974645 RepID=A0A2H0TXT3_9BACT|nr:MAG: hypothetical protein COU28_03820 [Candidatus Magasanikbacteria bacterium CG10_big_fil_rev_8_21_14_0_10_36_16]
MEIPNELNNLSELQNNFSKKNKKKNDAKKIIILSLFFLLLVAIIYLLFSYLKTQKELSMLKDPVAQEAALKVENDKLIQKIGKLIELSTTEDPVVGTVNDATSLAQQQKFFVNAKNGDKVLIYKDKALIYRPDNNKLINVGPVYIDSTSTTDISSNK